MATSGVASFDPTFDDILQDAAAMVGGGPLLADELISARRGLDYLLTDLQNRNVLLHKIETTVVPVSASVSALQVQVNAVSALTSSLDARIAAVSASVSVINTQLAAVSALVSTINSLDIRVIE